MTAKPKTAEPWQHECYGCMTNSHTPERDHSLFPWTCPDHGFAHLGYGVSQAKIREMLGPHQHLCHKCEGWIGCKQWPNGCPPDFEVSNVPKPGNGKVYDDDH